jgi:hypothetical protein
LEISDDASQDLLINEQGKTILNTQAVNRARLKIDTRKWLACKLVPKVYGPKPVEEDYFDPKIKQEMIAMRAGLDEKNRKEY